MPAAIIGQRAAAGVSRRSRAAPRSIALQQHLLCLRGNSAHGGEHQAGDDIAANNTASFNTIAYDVSNATSAWGTASLTSMRQFRGTGTPLRRLLSRLAIRRWQNARAALR